jgi:PAS domain S-box-containing protein
LADSEQRFRGLIEQSVAGILIIQDNILSYVNPRCAEIIGQGSAEDLIGYDPLSFIVEADRAKVAEAIRQLTDKERPNITLDFNVMHKNGSQVTVGANANLASYHGKPAIIALIQDISVKKRDEERILSYVAQLKATFLSTVQLATSLSEMRDPYTAGHERRVSDIAVAIATELGLDEQRIEGIKVAGYLHDIGKISLPAEILVKPRRLSPTEYALVQGHAQASYDVLKHVNFPWPVATIALQHHERMDGSGYPNGLKGDDILLESRIMAVSDVVEAMASHRPYRAGLGIDSALAEIELGRGTVYDAEVADACLKLFRKQGYEIPALS